MYLISKDGKSVVNMNHVTVIYTTSNCTLNADTISGKGSGLGNYGTTEDVRMAIRMVSEKIGKSEVARMPSDDEVRARKRLEEERHHNKAGRKTKGHGGS